jgi:hypothetical protein
MPASPKLDPIHTDALRVALRNDVLMEAVKRVTEAEAENLRSHMSAAVASANFHEAVLYEGQIQGILSLITLLGRYGRVG